MTDPSPISSGWQNRLSPFAFPIAAFALYRFIVHSLAYLGWFLDPAFRNGAWIERSAALRGNTAFDALFRWDASYYSTIAQNGYTDPRHANFFPAFPMEVRGLATLFSMDFQVAAIVASTFNALIAVIALYLLAEKLIGRDGARWAVVAFLAYPFSFFQVTAYPESLTVAAATTALALEVHSRKRWSLLAASLSALARHTSVYGAMAQSLWRFQAKEPWRTRILPLFAWGLGLGVFCAFLYSRYGDPLMFLTVRKIYWPDGFVPVWGLTIPRDTIMVPGVIFSLLPTLGVIVLWRTPQLRFLAIPTAIWLLVLFVSGGTGLGRHVSSVWPGFLGLGALFASRPTLGALVLALCAPFGGLLLFLHSHQHHIF